MNKTELEKAIENGDSVWYIVNNELAEIDLSCNFHEIKDNKLLTWYDKYSKDYYTHRKKLEDLYKSQAEAEHYLNHANQTRVETLPFLTWEEFKQKEYFDFFNGSKGFRLYISHTYNENIRLITYSRYNPDGDVLFEMPQTEENFYKAYYECVKLFRG